MARSINPRNWYGNLTMENAEQVAAAIRDLLTNQYFTTVSVNSNRLSRPEVHPSQRLSPYDENPIAVHFFEAKDGYPAWCYIHFHDTYGSWSVNEGAYIVFEYGAYQHQVMIEQEQSDKHIIWVFAVEDHTNE